MRSILAGCSLLATLALPPAAIAGSEPPPSAVALTDSTRESLAQVDAQLRRGEWAAADAAARSLVDNALHLKNPATFDALARLALAEAGQGKTEDALWHWGIAQNLKIDFDPKPFGAPGELLASHPLRGPDEVPAGLSVRRSGDGGPPFSPPNLVAAKKIELPSLWAARPRGMRLQVVVDAQGRAGSPVVLQSTSKALSYVLLEGLRDWRFEPARAEGTPVAAFYELKFPAHRPLVEGVELKDTPLAEIEMLLRAQRFAEAGKKADHLWTKTATGRDTIPSRPFLGVTLALVALAQAGQGQTDRAICRWQAAQTLEPRLYGVDLSAYGAAGKLLEDHPWGETFPGPKKPDDPNARVERPQVLSHREPIYPEYSRVDRVQSKVVVESILTATGAIRNLALLTPNAPPGMEASALDALCDWRFKPASYHGEPVTVYYSLTVNFEIRR